MVSGVCKKIVETAAKVGLARESLSRALSTPHVAEHLRRKVIRHLAIGGARAGATKVELLDSASELVRDRASTFVLASPASSRPPTRAFPSILTSELATFWICGSQKNSPRSFPMSEIHFPQLSPRARPLEGNATSVAGIGHHAGGIERNASAITNIIPTMSAAATAPAVIMAVSFEL
jgi:hypothetical protein